MVATQGLFLLNDDSVMDAADATAERILKSSEGQTEADIVVKIYEVILQQPPSDQEQQQIRAFLEQTEKQLAEEGAEEPKKLALAIACHAVFASSRFQILD
jgi:hypothetical protein